MISGLDTLQELLQFPMTKQLLLMMTSTMRLFEVSTHGSLLLACFGVLWLHESLVFIGQAVEICS